MYCSYMHCVCCMSSTYTICKCGSERCHFMIWIYSSSLWSIFMRQDIFGVWFILDGKMVWNPVWNHTLSECLWIWCLPAAMVMKIDIRNKEIDAIKLSAENVSILMILTWLILYMYTYKHIHDKALQNCKVDQWNRCNSGAWRKFLEQKCCNISWCPDDYF